MEDLKKYVIKVLHVDKDHWSWTDGLNGDPCSHKIGDDIDQHALVCNYTYTSNTKYAS